MDLDEQLKQVYNELYKDYPEAIDFLGKTKSDDKLIRIADEISKILLKQAATRGLYLIGKKNGVVGGGRIKFKTQVMNNLLNVNSFDDNPIQYEISADIGNGRMSAYAYPYNADRTNNDINKVIAACGTVQSNNGKKVKQGIWSHVLDFNGIIDIDTICSQIESGNTADLTNIVISYLDQIAHAESEIAKLI